jgi:hypothetical protein
VAVRLGRIEIDDAERGAGQNEAQQRHAAEIHRVPRDGDRIGVGLARLRARQRAREILHVGSRRHGHRFTSRVGVRPTGVQHGLLQQVSRYLRARRDLAFD